MYTAMSPFYQLKAAAGGLFYPLQLVVESFGFWTPTSLAVLKTIASHDKDKI